MIRRLLPTSDPEALALARQIEPLLLRGANDRLEVVGTALLMLFAHWLTEHPASERPGLWVDWRIAMIGAKANAEHPEWGNAIRSGRRDGSMAFDP